MTHPPSNDKQLPVLWLVELDNIVVARVEVVLVKSASFEQVSIDIAPTVIMDIANGKATKEQIIILVLRVQLSMAIKVIFINGNYNWAMEQLKLAQMQDLVSNLHYRSKVSDQWVWVFCKKWILERTTHARQTNDISFESPWC